MLHTTIFLENITHVRQQEVVFIRNASSFYGLFKVQFLQLLADVDRNKLAQSPGKFAQYLCKILDVYFAYHRDAYDTQGQ